jgi:hypothetical protein
VVSYFPNRIFAIQPFGADFPGKVRWGFKERAGNYKNNGEIYLLKNLIIRAQSAISRCLFFPIGNQHIYCFSKAAESWLTLSLSLVC